MADLNIQILANSVIKVVIPSKEEGEESVEVTDRKHILAWVQGIGKTQADAILDEANSVNNQGLDRSGKITCPECKHEYTQPLEFNPSSFFDLGS